MADKLDGSAIALRTIAANRFIDYSLPANTFEPNVASVLAGTARPKVSNLAYFGANTTANINGNQTITLTGANFQSNVTVYINGNAVPSVARVNSNTLTFTTAAQSANTYPVYVINIDDGGFCLFAKPGIVYA